MKSKLVPKDISDRRYALSQLVVLEINISCFAIAATCFDLNGLSSGSYTKIYV